MDSKPRAKTLTVAVRVVDGARIRTRSLQVTLPQDPQSDDVSAARDALRSWTAELEAALEVA